MHYSIYQYLKTCLHFALQKAYPQQYPHLQSIPITFSSITPDPSIDIATPYPQKIAQFLRLPVTTVSQQILSNFQTGSNFLSNTHYTIPDRGFFNFRISETFLLRSVYETSIDTSTIENASSISRSDIVCKLALLLQKNIPESLPSLSQFIVIPLPYPSAEYSAARMIALSALDGIHSVKTRDYFERKLLNEAKNCYRKCPIQTDDYLLSSLRFLIIKALYTRIMQLVTIKQAKLMN